MTRTSTFFTYQTQWLFWARVLMLKTLYFAHTSY